MNTDFKPIAYVKEGCPYSMKLLSFIEESDLTDRVDIVRCAPGTPVMDAVREKLAEGTGARPKFPTVEIEPGKFKTESDALIRYFEDRFGDDKQH